jgi:alkylated DNA repair dioxygenase AlkB
MRNSLDWITAAATRPAMVCPVKKPYHLTGQDTLPSAISRQVLALPDGEVILYQRVFTGTQRDRLFQELLDHTPWQQHTIKLYGRTMAVPRLSAWHGDPGAVYCYSGLRLEPLPWTPVLCEIKAVVEQLADTPFNSVLLNLYRHGQDSIGWHSDDEPELGHHPVIASVSLGAVRRFILRHKRLPVRLPLDLDAGSVLLMRGATQQHWQHQLPKTRKPTNPRINLTFRFISWPGLR